MSLWGLCSFNGLFWNMGLKAELERFAATTSIKGVGRAWKSSTLCLRVLWGLAVVCGISASLYQCSVLLADYFMYDSVVQLEEVDLNAYALNEDADTIPDVTVCNLNVFKFATNKSGGYSALEEYFRRVINYTECPNCTDQTSVEALKAQLLTLSGFYQNLKPEEIVEFGHSMEEFIPRCLLLSFDGYTTIQRDCITVPVIITRFPNPHYFNCFHFSTNGTGADDTGILVGYTLVLQLSHIHHDNYNNFFDPLMYDHSSTGAIVLAHPPNSWPWLERRPMYVAPGTQVTHPHDDVIKRKHFLRYWPSVKGIHRSPVDSPHKGQWRGALMFSSISAWTKCWVNNRDAGDLRCHCAQYDVTVMINE